MGKIAEYLLWTRPRSRFLYALFHKILILKIHEVKNKNKNKINLHLANKKRKAHTRVNNLSKIVRLESSKAGFQQKPVLLLIPQSPSYALLPAMEDFEQKLGGRWKDRILIGAEG